MIRNLLNILKTNVATCKSVGAPFITQLCRLYSDALSLYRLLSENISKAVMLNGEEVLKLPLIKAMKAVKREILIFISTWVSKSNDTKVCKVI